MEYDVTRFKNHVAMMGGPEKVVAIQFNNAYRKLFTDGPLDYALHLDEVEGIFKFKHKDPSGIPYTVIKPVVYIESIIFIDDIADLPRLSYSYIAG